MPADTALSRLGLWLRAHRRFIQAVQWGIVLVYAVLLIVPAMLPLPAAESHLFSSMAGIAQFVFWGVWWPGVIVSVLLLGRSWCGLFCPEGMLTEWTSGHGRGRRIPTWLKWPGWPLVAFVATTVYGQLISVYQYPQPALLILGGSTLAAMLVGYLYGRNKRVWCRYLCPVSGVFGLLARLAPLHYAVDRQAWESSPTRKTIPINCAPLIDIRRMEGASLCHQCGRCAGQRDAVQLACRPVNREIAQLRPDQAQPWEVLLLLYGMIGVAIGAFQWSATSTFVMAKQAAAGWLIDHETGLFLLDDNVPWWLLTHYPSLNDSFCWLDGAMIVGYIALVGSLLGSWLWFWLGLSARALQADWRSRRLQLAYCLTPLAGVGLILGLSATSFSLLRGMGLMLPWKGVAQLALLGLGLLWSLRLFWLQTAGAEALPRGQAMLLAVPAWAAIVLCWWQFLQP
ncbi:4Fe-4S binding protein [Chitinimonas sp. JJ19]|uniref:4Fe-4S binding protein n=1 Tax=Chitinimonas sp. JJ19 TaxID=3109352 RepID=UPI0030028EC6